MNEAAVAQYVGKLVDIAYPDGKGATAFIVGYDVEHRFSAREETITLGLFSDEGYALVKIEDASIGELPVDQQHSAESLREYFRDMTSRADPSVNVEMVRSLVGRTVSRVPSPKHGGGRLASFAVCGYVEEHWADPDDWDREIVTFWLIGGGYRYPMLDGDVYSVLNGA